MFSFWQEQEELLDSHFMVSVWGVSGWLPLVWGSECSSQNGLGFYDEFLFFYTLQHGQPGSQLHLGAMRSFFILSPNPHRSLTFLLWWGLEAFTTYSGQLDTGKLRRTRVTSSDGSVDRCFSSWWPTTHTWCETMHDSWVRVSLTYTWTMSPPLLVQEALSGPPYLGFSNRDPIEPWGMGHHITEQGHSLPVKWHLTGNLRVGNSIALPGLTAELLRGEAMTCRIK